MPVESIVGQFLCGQMVVGQQSVGLADVGTIVCITTPSITETQDVVSIFALVFRATPRFGPF